MATQGVQMNFWGVQNTTFDENPYENERIRVILGCAISSIARAKHRCTGGWLILWWKVKICYISEYYVPSNYIKHLLFAEHVTNKQTSPVHLNQHIQHFNDNWDEPWFQNIANNSCWMHEQWFKHFFAMQNCGIWTHFFIRLHPWM